MLSHIIRQIKPQATGFRRFDAPDEMARWFKARLASGSSSLPHAPPSSSSSSPPAAEAKGELPLCRYFVMQEERWRTPAVRASSP